MAPQWNFSEKTVPYRFLKDGLAAKNVLQFVLETAHQQIPYKVTSAHADIISCYWCDGGFMMNRKLIPTLETAPLFL